jgi:hypothetical protein
VLKRTEETLLQTLMNSDQIKNSLEKLGYSLKDFGNHWRTKALYRGGDNPTAIKVYKNTGVWQDYVQGESSMPLVKLVELTLQTKDPKIIQEYVSKNSRVQETHIVKEKIEMDKIYPKECLSRLFPNYSFYKKRGISEETQKLYQCGLAGNGQMYQRIVFPIYNPDGQIFGFSGRKINDNNEAPKWKHIGTKTKWVYPAFVPQEQTVDSLIEEKKEVILVESIGDSLALTDEGYANNLVTFGLDCSPALLNYLCSKDLRKIIIATNNDQSKQKNHGKIAALKNYMKLSQFFDFEQLEIQLPWANDFGDMRQQEMSFKDWYNTPQAAQEQKLSEYKDFCSANRASFQDKKLEKFFKKIENFGN